MNVERKTVSKPTGKLQTTNLGINSILNPKINKVDTENIDTSNLPHEPVNVDQLMHTWKAYSLKVKRDKKDSFYSTLTHSNPTLGSDLVIKIKIKNSIALIEYELEKPELLKYLRAKLKNYTLDIEHTVDESTKLEFSDSKSKFNKLLAENQSLEKFRKLFNLDIEY